MKRPTLKQEKLNCFFIEMVDHPNGKYLVWLLDNKKGYDRAQEYCGLPRVLEIMADKENNRVRFKGFDGGVYVV